MGRRTGSLPPWLKGREEEGREGGREGGKEGGKEGGREGRRAGGRAGRRAGGRAGGRAGRKAVPTRSSTVQRVRLTGKKREQCDCQAESVITISPKRNTQANQECITPVMELGRAGGREGGRAGGREGERRPSG
jgi:hypothetical protein